jgi:hypothetical protein
MVSKFNGFHSTEGNVGLAVRFIESESVVEVLDSGLNKFSSDRLVGFLGASCLLLSNQT